MEVWKIEIESISTLSTNLYNATNHNSRNKPPKDTKHNKENNKLTKELNEQTDKPKDYWSKKKRLGIYTIITLIQLALFIFVI